MNNWSVTGVTGERPAVRAPGADRLGGLYRDLR
jgi:hypothetical protein